MYPLGYVYPGLGTPDLDCTSFAENSATDKSYLWIVINS